ncbi:MAG: ArsR/SmtB family transcription factor, partial [Candidatus Hydrothermarchaeales archaeon]
LPMLKREKMDKVICDETGRELPKEIVDLILKNEEKLDDALEIVKLLANPTRLKIAFLLSKNELCTCDLEKILDKEQTLISHYIRAFKDLDLLDERRDGKWRYYSINGQKLKRLINVMMAEGE